MGSCWAQSSLIGLAWLQIQEKPIWKVLAVEISSGWLQEHKICQSPQHIFPSLLLLSLLLNLKNKNKNKKTFKFNRNEKGKRYNLNSPFYHN